jgi:hypothetical protein
MLKVKVNCQGQKLWILIIEDFLMHFDETYRSDREQPKASVFKVTSRSSSIVNVNIIVVSFI